MSLEFGMREKTHLRPSVRGVNNVLAMGGGGEFLLRTCKVRVRSSRALNGAQTTRCRCPLDYEMSERQVKRAGVASLKTCQRLPRG